MKSFAQSAQLQKIKYHLITALKIGIGSALAIFLATLFKLPNPASAGTITLLTLIAHTRSETLRLIVQRIVTFFLAVLACWVITRWIHEVYLAFALYLIFMVFFSELAGWSGTLSVNAVFGAQFLINQDFTFGWIAGEFGLLLIGISIAFAFNMLQPVVSGENALYHDVLECEEKQQDLLRHVSAYLKTSDETQWQECDIHTLKTHLRSLIRVASAHAQNTLDPKTEWFAAYFNTRYHQVLVLEELHEHTRQMPVLPSGSQDTALVIDELVEAVPSIELPDKQMAMVEQLLGQVSEGKGCDREFTSRALLFHMVLDLQEYVHIKQQFLQSLTDAQKQAIARKEEYRNKENRTPFYLVRHFH